MSLKLTLKYKISSWFPAKLKNSAREKKGENLNNNPSVLIVCKDTDEAYYRALKNFVQHLKGEYGIREILVVFYSENQEESLPGYLGHLKELDYFCIDNLNWRLRPNKIIERLNLNSYDILLDLCSVKSHPLSCLISESNASFKVGRAGRPYSEFMDLIIEISEFSGEEEFLNQVEYYLSKLSFN